MTRIPTREAAGLIGVSIDAVRMYVRLGYLKAVTASGELGRGRRMYFDRDEVEAFRDGGAPAVDAYRKNKSGRPPKAKV